MIGFFSVMSSILTDDAGEFSADEIREVASILNVKLCTMSSKRPFQNGFCGRVHVVTDMMLLKLEAENRKMESEVLLSSANMAKNTLQIWNGYRLVFGKS